MPWTIDPTKFGDQVRIDHRTLCRRIALEIDQRLVLNTPVDTGRARSNWLASISAPRTDTVDVRGQAQAIADAAVVIQQAPEFPVIYLANNLPYIQRLNEGSSKQAPAGFVEGAIDAVTAVFK